METSFGQTAVAVPVGGGGGGGWGEGPKKIFGEKRCGSSTGLL